MARLDDGISEGNSMMCCVFLRGAMSVAVYRIPGIGCLISGIPKCHLWPFRFSIFWYREFVNLEGSAFGEL